MMYKCSIGDLSSPVSAPFQYKSGIHTYNAKRSTFIHNPQRCSQNLAGGANFFSRFRKLHVAKSHPLF